MKHNNHHNDSVLSSYDYYYYFFIRVIGLVILIGTTTATTSPACYRTTMGVVHSFAYQQQLSHQQGTKKMNNKSNILSPSFFLRNQFVQSSEIRFNQLHNHQQRYTTITKPTPTILLSSSSSSSSSNSNDFKMSNAIGFIGLGIMGEGMAARLLSEGIAGQDDTKPLIVWNRSNEKCVALQTKFPDKKIIMKSTPREVLEACNIVYSMLSTPEASSEVFYATPDGILAGVTSSTSIVDCATLAESDMQRMNEAIVQKGGRFLEAPVSGSKVPAAMGALIFLCAGSEELFNEVKDNGLNVMGKASHFFGTEVGAATRAKLVVNSLMGTMMAAYGEALALSEAVGLNPTTMMEVIGQGAIQSPLFSMKGPKMIQQDHAPHFPLKHAHKDMKLATDLAEQVGVEYSVMKQAETLYSNARTDTDLNIADEDFSAIYEKIHKDSTNEYSKNRKST